LAGNARHPTTIAIADLAMPDWRRMGKSNDFA
jgi:hypothetical protein